MSERHLYKYQVKKDFVLVIRKQVLLVEIGDEGVKVNEAGCCFWVAGNGMCGMM